MEKRFDLWGIYFEYLKSRKYRTEIDSIILWLLEVTKKAVSKFNFETAF